MEEFARALPRLRKRVAKDLGRDGMPRERVLACATRLLDRGFFRIGSEDYAEENDTYGIATMGKRHVTVKDDVVTFDYESKGGQRRLQAFGDPKVAEVVTELKRRRGGGEELLAWREGRRWVDVKSRDVNEYVKEAAGREFSAKDFRTWSATVLAAVALSVSGVAASGSKTARKRAKTRAIKETASYLGNTPAVCRASYIDPRVFDRFDGGLTIGGVLPELAADTGAWPDVQGRVEAAVLDLLAGDRSSDAVARARRSGRLERRSGPFGSGCGASGAPGSGMSGGEGSGVSGPVGPGSTGSGPGSGTPGLGSVRGWSGAGGAGTSACGNVWRAVIGPLLSGAGGAKPRRPGQPREPKLVAYVAAGRPNTFRLGAPSTTPMPISRKRESRMLWRCGGLPIHAATMPRGDERFVPAPQARFSPTNQDEVRRKYPVRRIRCTKSVPSREVCEK